MRKLWTVVCCLLVIPCAFAQQARDSSPDLRDNIKSGQKVTVRLSDGRQLQGAVSDVTEAELGHNQEKHERSDSGRQNTRGPR
jgi:hypothetical protein